MIEDNTPQRAFNIPFVLVVMLAVLVAVHLARLAIDYDLNVWVIYAFGFVPGRYAGRALELPFPFGFFGDVFVFVSYALLHAGWVHLLSNSLWLVAFGAPVARRFGALRFVVFGAVTAAAGAGAHLVTHWGELVPMVGASAAVSGYMAAAIRFAFTPGGPLTAAGRFNPDAAVMVPAVGMFSAFRNRSVVAFVGIWMVFNFLFGVGVVSLGGQEVSIAWQAHVGGFVAGLLLFRLFDPVRPAPLPDF